MSHHLLWPRRHQRWRYHTSSKGKGNALRWETLSFRQERVLTYRYTACVIQSMHARQQRQLQCSNTRLIDKELGLNTLVFSLKIVLEIICSIDESRVLQRDVSL